MSYPSTIDTFVGTSAQGTSLLSSPDHAQDHRTLGSAVGTVENVLGTTAGTSVIKNFAAGDFAARINSGGTLQQVLTGTVNNSVFGTPSITGGTYNSGVFGTPSITGGTGALMTLGTPSIDQITGRNSGTAINFAKSISPSEGTLTDSAGGTLTADAYASQIYYCAMGTSAGNRTVGTPSNASPYQQLTYAFKASGSANGTLVWASIFRFSQDVGTPTLGTGTTWNYYSWRYNAIDSKWDYAGQSKNLI